MRARAHAAWLVALQPEIDPATDLGMVVRVLIVLLASSILALAGCGGSDDAQTRPIEVLYYVSGGPGVDFGFAIDPDPSFCGSNAIGIQSANASHQFESNAALRCRCC